MMADMESHRTNTKDKKTKLTDTERHKRFLDMAREVEAQDDHDAFDAAFRKVVKPQTIIKRPKSP